jgi:hypothetical protein
MAKTRATTAPPPAPVATTTQDEDEVDYGLDDDHLTDISELERQLAAPTSAQPVRATPEPTTAAVPPLDPPVALPTALITSMVNTMNALVNHLGGAHGPAASPSTQGIPPLVSTALNPRIESIRDRWPAVNVSHLQEILENRFQVENLLKLNASFIYTPDRRLENISLGPVEIATTAKNVQIKEYVEISYLLKPLTVYADIIRELAPPEVRDNLGSALFRYMHHLLDINERCTWHSVRLYHFSFHRKRMLSSTGVYDYEGWLKYNDSEFQYLLQARTFQGTKRPSDGHPSGPPAKRFNTGNGAAASAGSASCHGARRIRARMVDYGCCARMCARLFLLVRISLWFDYLSGSIIISLVRLSLWISSGCSSGCCSVRRRAGNAGYRCTG